MIDTTVKIMLITDITFEAFLNCPTKAWSKISEVGIDNSDYVAWKQAVSKAYEENCRNKLQIAVPKGLCLKDITLDKGFDNRAKLILNCQVKKGELQSRIHALEFMSDFQKHRRSFYLPIRQGNRKVSL